MKTIAVTVAVLALGLAACAQSDDANNMAANDVYTENAAGNALDTASNAIENAGEAVENAGEAVENVAD